MTKFKVGDYVQHHWDDKGSNTYVGVEGLITSVSTDTDYNYPYQVGFSDMVFSDKELKKMVPMKSRFKVGDSVTITVSSAQNCVNKILGIRLKDGKPEYYTTWAYEGQPDTGTQKGWYNLEAFTIVKIIKGSIKSKRETNMKPLTNMMKKLLDADTQTLVKAGYVNGDLLLTNEGTLALESILFTQNKAELVKLAQEVIDEEKASK